MAYRSQSGRITIAELRQRAQAGSLTEEEMRRFFAADEENSEAFAPAVKIDTAHVDTSGEEITSEEATQLLEQAVIADNARKSELESTIGAPGAPRTKLLAEGDSWFNLPPIGWPATAIDILRGDYDVWNLAMWGDEIAEMVATKQYRQLLESKLYRHFLFSGGGNDVLGSIGSYVTKRKAGDSDPANAPGYVRPAFRTKVKDIIALYKTVAADARKWGPPGIVLYVHGYANAIPRKNGKYLGKPLKALDFDADQHAALARAVVATMVGIFNDALRGFASSTANVVYVDMRKAVGASDWSADEIHPLKSGARKVAAAFSSAVRANEPSV